MRSWSARGGNAALALKRADVPGVLCYSWLLYTVAANVATFISLEIHSWPDASVLCASYRSPGKFGTRPLLANDPASLWFYNNDAASHPAQPARRAPAEQQPGCACCIAGRASRLGLGWCKGPSCHISKRRVPRQSPHASRPLPLRTCQTAVFHAFGTHSYSTHAGCHQKALTLPMRTSRVHARTAPTPTSASLCFNE